jgi:hypothetical protein
MKKALILLTSAIALMAIAAAPGCSGGGDDDDDDDDGGSLHSGTYAVSNVGIQFDVCGDGTGASYYEGVAEADVTVAATSILVSGFPDDLGYDIVGNDLVDNTFGTPATSVIDFTDPGTLETATGANDGNTYNCVVDFTTEFAGTITGTDAFTLADTISLTQNSGACTVAIVSSAFVEALAAFPCSVVDGADFAL